MISLSRGGVKYLKKPFFYFLYVKLQTLSFQPIFLIGTYPMLQSPFGNNSRAESTIFCIERISYSLKLLSGHFMGNP